LINVGTVIEQIPRVNAHIVDIVMIIVLWRESFTHLSLRHSLLLVNEVVVPFDLKVCFIISTSKVLGTLVYVVSVAVVTQVKVIVIVDLIDRRMHEILSSLKLVLHGVELLLLEVRICIVLLLLLSYVARVQLMLLLKHQRLNHLLLVCLLVSQVLQDDALLRLILQNLHDIFLGLFSSI
jgi:hypothetical protein